MKGCPPLISVVIPLYNKERWVARCLESVRAQTFTDYEIIVVDDGSTDSSPNIARQFLTDRDRLISQTNAGPGAARNRGIAAARGEYLAFIDADDEWVPGFLQRAADAFDRAQGSLDVVSQASLSLPLNVTIVPHVTLRNRTVRLGPHSSLGAASRVIAAFGVGRIVVRTSLVRELGGFYAADRVTNGEDMWLFYLMAVRACIHADSKLGLINHADAGDMHGAGRIRCRDALLPPVVRCGKDLLRLCPAELRGVMRALLVQNSIVTGVKLLCERRLALGAPLLVRALVASVPMPATWLVAVRAVALRTPGARAILRAIGGRDS